MRQQWHRLTNADVSAATWTVADFSGADIRGALSGCHDSGLMEHRSRKV